MSFPVSAQIDDTTRVEVFLHSFFLGDRERQCWTYLTHGFRDLGQREMVLSLLIEDDEDPEQFPKTPVRLFQLLVERFDGGRPVDFGDASRLGQKGILGFTAAFYVPAIQFEGLPSLIDHLALVLVHDEEYAYAQQYGLTRFLSRLGRYCSSFPYPTWNTGARPSLFHQDSRESSILATAHHVMAEHSYVQQEDTSLRLQLHEKDAPLVSDALESLQEEQVAVISTAFAPGCDASLYWQEGQVTPGAFAAPDTSARIIGGSFIALSQGEQEETTIEEDGFALTLSPDAWQSLCGTITDRSSCRLPAGGGKWLLIETISSAPVSSTRQYEPVAVWKRLQGDQQEQAESRKVEVVSWADLSPDQNLSERVSQAALMDYLELVRQMLSKAMEDESARLSFALDLKITPERTEAGLSSERKLNPAFVSFITDAVEKLPPCPVTSQISVRVSVTVNAEGE